MTLVRDIMEKNVLCLSPETTLGDAADALSERQVWAAPVCSPEGRVLGVLSKTDIAECFVPSGPARTVREAMTPDALSIAAGSPMEAAIHTMAFEGVHRLVVVDADGHLEGIVSTMDVLRQLAGFPRRDARVIAVGPPESASEAAMRCGQPSAPPR